MAAGTAAGGYTGFAQTVPIDAAPPGQVETGTPLFNVLGPEALGLSTPPTDLTLMPDGRVLAFARAEFALGDGLRWEVVRRAAGEEELDTDSVAVDAEGRIYLGATDRIARVELGPDRQWRLATAALLPRPAGGTLSHLTEVSMLGDQWYWHSGTGPVIAWRPGRGPARLAGETQGIDRLFGALGMVFASSRADGSLVRLTADGFETVIAANETTASRTITCSVPLDEQRTLIGTSTDGLKVFDGAVMRPLVASGPLAGGRRINDICATVAGLYVAAVDTVGLIFFDRTGRTIQVLDHRMDHRLARAQRVIYSAGTVWALLLDGLARVQFPSRVSNFESFIPTGVTYAQPYRHDGRLWLAADGRALRGIYEDGRLVRFDPDSPPGQFVHSLCTLLGPLLATNEHGIYQRYADGWRIALEGVTNARIDIPSSDGRRWLYTARGRYGWIVLAPDGSLEAESIAEPALGDVYGVQQERDGDVWLELGMRRTARIRIVDDRPHIQFFDGRAGLPDGWVQVFVVDGIVRFNIADNIHRFDDAQQRFVRDTELVERIPDMAVAYGRPREDTRGRLWLTARGTVHVLEPATGRVTGSLEEVPPGIRPYLYLTEAGGIVWLHEARRLARFDPSFPVAPAPPLRAMITSVTFTAEDRTVYGPGPVLPELPYSSNSLSLHFAAPGVPLGEPVIFEVMLEGDSRTWSPSGPAGVAAFNQLAEGDYELRVRPRAGSETGAEATLAFTINPPWYRTTTAYVGYIAALGLVVFAIARTNAVLERREKIRLERVVDERTAELRGSEDRYRRLSEELDARVKARTTELHNANDQLLASNRELEAFSYSVSHDLRAPLRNISGFADLLRRRAAGNVDRETARYLQVISSESVRLGKLIDSLLSYSRVNRTELNAVRLDMNALVAAVRADLASETAGRAIDWRVGSLPAARGDATLVRLALANLLGNAVKFTRPRSPAVIEVDAPSASADAAANPQVTYRVRDNGVGFDPRHGDKLFGVFQRLHDARDFEGTGIGLANVERIFTRHGGRVWAEGQPDAGATFFFTLPRAET